ncbi:MAG: hypothetical protein ACFFED_03290 [Candidatus Thorarchaeota archaeon]
MEHLSDKELKRVDTYRSLLTALNVGIEDLLGPASKGLIFNTGVEEGRRLAQDMNKTNALLPAIDLVNEAYEGVWSIELRKNGDDQSYFYEDDLNQPSVNIMVRDCPVRTAGTNNGMHQCGPICYLTNGYLAGMLEVLMGEKVGIEILHAGPLACKKRIYFRK